jgi:hypothetical protein
MCTSALWVSSAAAAAKHSASYRQDRGQSSTRRAKCFKSFQAAPEPRRSSVLPAVILVKTMRHAPPSLLYSQTKELNEDSKDIVQTSRTARERL